jgi:Short C-terminal domain
MPRERSEPQVTASRGRMAAAWTLVVLGIVVGVLAVVAGYLRYQALDTPTVEETATQLIEDDEVRNQIAAQLVDELFANVDVEAGLRERLPPEQKRLAPFLAGAGRELADRASTRLLERPRVQELWIRSIVTAHEQLLAVLDDDTTVVSTEGGFVVLNLRPLVIQLGDQVAIVGRVADRLPENAGQIKIMKADQLETAQDLTQLLKRLAAVLWIVPFLLWAIALWLARGRRRAVLRTIGIGLITVGLLVLVARRVAGGYVVDDLVKSDPVRPAAQNAWDILTALLADGGWTVLGLGVIAVIAVWLSGPSPSATATRRGLAPFLVRPELAFGAAALLFLLLILWGPTVQTRRVHLVIAAAILLAIGVEILRRQTAREFPDAVAADLGARGRSMMGRVRRSSAEDDRVLALERLQRLHDQGALTDEEFAAEKARLLD